MPPFSELFFSSFCLHQHLNLNNFFPPFLASLPSSPFTQLPESFTCILAADTNTSYRQLLFLPSLSLYLILFLENSGFLCKSWRGARNNATFVLRGVHLVVTEISHLLCGPGVNGERQPLVTCKAFSKHHKNHQELPVCSVVNGNVGEINQRKTSDPLNRVTYLWAFRGHSDGCCSAGRIQHAFPVWCRFSCWGEPEELSRQLPAEEGSWRLRSKQKPGGRWGGGCHGEKKKKS